MAMQMPLWPFLPNWREPYQLTLTYATDVISSRRGYEQRRALRQTARKSASFSATVGVDRFGRLMRSITRNQGVKFAMADPVVFVRTVADAPVGAITVQIDEPASWLALGTGAAILDRDQAQLLTVDHVTLEGDGAYQLTLSTPLTSAWRRGTRVFRVLYGRLGASIGLNEPAKGVADGTITFDVDPGSELNPDPPGAPTTFNGYEVFTLKPNWATARDLTLARDLQLVDYGRGRIEGFNPIPFSVQTRGGDFLGKTSDEIAALVDFFRRQRGRRGSFYAPSDEPDLPVPTQPASAYLYLPGDDIYNAVYLDPLFSAISLKMSSGERSYHTVTAVELINGNTRLTVGEVLPAIDPASVEVISWMPLQRLGSDSLVISYSTNSVASVKLSFVSIALPPEAAA